MNISLKIFLLVLSSVAFIAGCKEDKRDLIVAPISSAYDELLEQGDLTITVQAIDMAGLKQIVNQDNITLFAPTDSAFTSFMQDIGVDSLSGLYNLYGPENFRQLVLYHLLEKKVKGMDVVNSYIATAAKNNNGNNIHAYISRVDKNVSLNAFEANVTKGDIEADGSVIHKIDGVLTPLTLYGLIRVNPNFGQLKSAISKTQDNLETILNQENSLYTIFGPTDAAMNSYLSDAGFTSWADYSNSYSSYSISCIVKYHIINDELLAQELSNKTYNTIYTGHAIDIFKEQGGSIKVLDEKRTEHATVKTTDITAVNGTMHVIDKVLEHN